MDADLQAQLASDAQRAVAEFQKADEEYRELLAEVEAEMPDAFRILWDKLDERNIAVVTARKKIKAARANVAPFKVSVRKSVVYDADGFIQYAKEVGRYEDLLAAGVISTTIDRTQLKGNLDKQSLIQFQERCGRTIETGVTVYGPKELGTLK